MKKFFAVAIISLITLGTNVSAKEWNKIRIGVEGAYPPFSSIEKDGTLKVVLIVVKLIKSLF